MGMDEALIKPQKPKRLVWLRPHAAGSEGAGAAADVSARGSLVEVRDPRALRPRDFRVDFVHDATSSVMNIAQGDLPPLMEAVLAGTDATLLVMGGDGSGYTELIDGADGGGRGGLGTLAAARMVAELQTRQARHRESGSGGYAFQIAMQYAQITGERVDDLLTDRPDPTRVLDTEDGVVVEGLHTVSVASPEEVEQHVQAAQRRRSPVHRGRTGTVLIIQVTQADYFAGWGLFGSFMLVEAPTLDPLAEDRGLVQLREGFDTFHGLFHLRSLVQAWQPRQPIDVGRTALTALLRDSLCAGSVQTCVLLCLRQGQPEVSRAALEFLDDFGKMETNPVSCDHRVAGLFRALRAERLLASRGAPGANRDAEADARRIILELEKRLHAVEREQQGVIRAEEFREGRGRELQDKLVSVVREQEALHDRLVGSEEDHLEACQGVVELQLANVEVREELSECHYEDNVLLVLLEQEVSEMQVAMRSREEQAELTVSGLARSEQQLREAGERSEQQLARSEQQLREAGERSEQQLREVGERAVTEAQASIGPAKEAQLLRRLVAELEENLRLSREAERGAVAAQDKSADELMRARSAFEQSLAGLPTAAAGTGAASPSAPSFEAGADVAANLVAKLVNERRQLRAHVRELQDQLVKACQAALAWAPADATEDEQARLRSTAAEAAARVAESTVGESVDEDLRAALAELERERLRSASILGEQQRLQAQYARLEAEIAELRHASTTAAAPLGAMPAQTQVPVGTTDATDSAQSVLVERNRELQRQVDLLTKQAPAEQRSQMQRLSFLEGSVPKLEAERSELLVRATVAEEQLEQLQKRMKELIEGYHMQILDLKLQGKGRGGPVS